MVKFRQIFLDKIPIGQNKNGTVSYSFSQENYDAGKCGKGHTIIGDIYQGDHDYDAARANIGSPWMMFTKTQGRELIDNTTSTWTSINGVNGRKFTSNTDSSKYIFLPAGGGWDYTTHYNVGSEGNYWSTVRYSSSEAWYMYFSSNGVYLSNNYRRCGRSICSVYKRKW